MFVYRQATGTSLRMTNHPQKVMVTVSILHFCCRKHIPKAVVVQFCIHKLNYRLTGVARISVELLKLGIANSLPPRAITKSHVSSLNFGK